MDRILITGLAIICMMIFVYIIIILNGYVSKQRKAAVRDALDTLVQTSEQLYGPDTGPRKLDAVQNWLAERRINSSVGDIEAAVLRLHASGHDWHTAHAYPSNTIRSMRVPTTPLAVEARAATKISLTEGAAR